MTQLRAIGMERIVLLKNRDQPNSSFHLRKDFLDAVALILFKPLTTGFV